MDVGKFHVVAFGGDLLHLQVPQRPVLPGIDVDAAREHEGVKARSDRCDGAFGGLVEVDDLTAGLPDAAPVAVNGFAWDILPARHADPAASRHVDGPNSNVDATCYGRIIRPGQRYSERSLPCSPTSRPSSG